jgi:hypothetical protein
MSGNAMLRTCACLATATRCRPMLSLRVWSDFSSCANRLHLTASFPCGLSIREREAESCLPNTALRKPYRSTCDASTFEFSGCGGPSVGTKGWAPS